MAALQRSTWLLAFTDLLGSGMGCAQGIGCLSISVVIDAGAQMLSPCPLPSSQESRIFMANPSAYFWLQMPPLTSGCFFLTSETQAGAGPGRII